MGEHDGDRARGHARAHVVRAAGEDDRHARAEHDPCRVRVREERELLRDHVARLEIGHQQNVGVAGDLGLDLFDRRRFLADRVVHRERTIEQPARDLTAVRHLAESRRLQGRLDLRVHRFHRRQNRNLRQLHAKGVAELDRVLHDVDLVVEAGIDVDRGIGDEQGLVVGGHVHHEHVAQAPRGAQTGLFGHDCAQQLIGVQRSLHQHLGFAHAHQLHRLCRSRIAVWRVDDAKGRDVESVFFRDRADLRFGANQDRHDQVRFRGFDCTAQGRFVARVRDRRDHGRKRLAALDDGGVAVVLLHRNLGHLDHFYLHLLA